MKTDFLPEKRIMEFLNTFTENTEGSVEYKKYPEFNNLSICYDKYFIQSVEEINKLQGWNWFLRKTIGLSLNLLRRFWHVFHLNISRCFSEKMQLI